MKTKHNIFRITAAFVAAATLLSGCYKEEQAALSGEGGYELIVEVDAEDTSATKTTITQDGNILPVVWKKGDKLYVAGATDGYIGCLELDETQSSGEGVAKHTARFKGNMKGWSSTQVLHFYYLGASTPTLTGNKYSFDISSQGGTLKWIQENGHISHAATSSALAPGSHTLSLTMNNMNAVILYDLSEWTMGVDITGTFNKAVLDLKTGTFDTSGCAGNIELTLDKCTASTYVTFIPDEKALTFRKGATVTPTRKNKVEAGKFYTNAGAAIKILMKDDSSLPGVFSVSPTKKVYFSKGNVYARYDASTKTYSWGMYETQYEYVGGAPGNSTIDKQQDGAIVDLFGWSTPSTYYGINTAEGNAPYSGAFKDWANNFDEEEGWFTMTTSEWAYLRGDNDDRRGKYKSIVYVCGVACAVYAPDNYKGTIADSYDATTWPAAEAAGLMALPAAGRRAGSVAYNVGGMGAYWSSTPTSVTYPDWLGAYGEKFYPGTVELYEDGRRCGLSVRLVKEATDY